MPNSYHFFNRLQKIIPLITLLQFLGFSIYGNPVNSYPNDTPTPWITASGSTALCGGNSVTLTSSEPTGNQWNVDGVAISGATSQSITVTTAGSYTVTFTDGSGSATSDAMPVTVSTTAPPTPTITSSRGTVLCSYANTSLFSSAPAGNQWNFNGSPIANATWTYWNVFSWDQGSGDYSVTVTNGCGSATSAPITITFNPTPQVSMIPNGPTTFCSGGAVTLTTTTATPPVTFNQWYLNGSILNGATSSTLNATAPGLYYLQVGNAYGCLSSAQNTVTVTVNPLPTVSAGGPYGNLSTTDAPITLTGSPAGGTFSGTGVSGNTFNPAVSGTGTFPITYSYTNSNGCSASATTLITVTCDLTVSEISGPKNVCYYLDPAHSAEDAVYTVSATNASGFNGTVQSAAHATIVSLNSTSNTSTIAVHYSSAPSPGSYIGVIVTNACGGASINKKIFPIATVPTTPGALVSDPAFTNPCMLPDGSHIIFTLTPGNYANSYIWTYPSGTTPNGSTSDNILDLTINPSSMSNTSQVTVQASNYCGTNNAIRTINLTKTIPTAPAFVQPIGHVCGNNDILYTVSQQSSAAFYTWSSSTGTGISLGASTTNSVPANFSNFCNGSISVMGGNYCGSSPATTLNISCLSCRMTLPVNTNAEAEISIYPNPSDGDFSIRLNNMPHKSFSAFVEIRDLSGKIVYSRMEKSRNGLLLLKMSSKLYAGIYMVTCIQDGQKAVAKLVVKK
jgi:hypothetical protein